MTEAQAGPRLRAAVVAAAAVLLLAGLGVTDASAPDEPRYLQVAEELRSMQHGPGGLVVLHLNGEVYTQKPPLYYWLAALAGTPFGRVTEGAARLPSALAGIAVIALVLRLGTRLLGGLVAVLGAALLLTVYEFGWVGRRALLDMLLAAFELLALTAFWWADRGIGPRRRQVALFHGAMGLAVLTKGPVGLIVPLLAAAGFLLWEGRLRDLRRVLPPWGWLLSVVPGLLWVAAATALAPAGYAQEAVGENVLGRFFAGTSHERPFYYFLYKFPTDFLPWTLLWPVVGWAALRRVFVPREVGGAGEETRRAWRFLLAWVGTSLLFFSLSSGKRGLYMFPAFPAAALLCADALVRWLGGRVSLPRALTVGAGAVAVVVAVLGLEGLLAGAGHPLILREGQAEEAHGAWLLAFGCAVLGSLVAAVVTWVVLRRHRAPLLAHPAVAIAGAFAVEAAVFWLLVPALDPITSPRPIALAAAHVTPPGQPIGLLGDRSMAGGIAYYGERRVAELDTRDDVERFVASGGHAIVVKRRKLDRVEVVTPVEVVASARSGRREVVVVVPRSPAAVSAPAAAATPPAARDGGFAP